MPKLTKRIVDSLLADPAGKDIFAWDSGDGALKGFGVRVKPSGIKSFLVQYRTRQGQTRRLLIGRLGELTTDEARVRAADRLKEVRDGADPSAARREIRGAILVEELCDLYLADAKHRIKPASLSLCGVLIEKHVKPLLGRKPVSELRLADIEKLQVAIATGKTAQPRRKAGRGGTALGGRSVAARTVGMFSTILEFARRQGVIEVNPARGVRKFPDVKRTRYLSFDEMVALGEAMRLSEAEIGSDGAIAAIRALLLTGCRRNEILSLPWEWLDAKARCIRFGDTKSGAQLRPIGATAAEFLAARPHKKGAIWVFPAERGDGHFIGLPRVLARLCSKAKLEGVTLHTLRHSFAAVAAEMGYSELTIAGLLGHKLPGVTVRYAHVPDRALLSAADTVSARIGAILDGRQIDADIVPFRTQA